ncbi:putative RWD, RING finger and WD repeat-containing protein [Vanrija pseudolonga]|uniref:Purtative RWD, RING finger and WD repeat-containing protein n=1 Tax=Vanrija pseudolonga TaxID=143232 RepID=A0AAF0Y3J1_9TREE|nr:purtative RWD, RING finger and WD repeat-containing protein [Vanrija pseudolonga]
MHSPSPSRVPLPPSGPASRRSSVTSPRGLSPLVSAKVVRARGPSTTFSAAGGSILGLGASVASLAPPEVERRSSSPADPFQEGATITVNQPVGSLSISPSSRDVCLASRKGLYILDLNNVDSAPRFVPQGGTWQIADCQWSPHAVTDNLILSTSSQKLLIWDLAAQTALMRSIDAHSRAITDINWHALNPNLMATVAMDAGIRGWDLRMDGNTPFMRLSAWGAAGTQVKWNRQHEHILATAHGKDVIVWDDRKGSVPVVVIKAHDAKIYGIDWDRRERHKIVTCSLDRTIKYWNVPELSPGNEQLSDNDFVPLPSPIGSMYEPRQTIQTNYPVWRARHLPFGYGVLALPQRGETALEMFGYDCPETPGVSNAPVERFEGHADVVKEFVWRKRGGDDLEHEDREFQLVTWSKDRTLRIWPVSREVSAKVGYQAGAPITVLSTRRGARDVTYTRIPGREGAVAGSYLPAPKVIDPHNPHLCLPTMFPPTAPPSGIARQRMLAAPKETGMTRGGGTQKAAVDQIEWLTKVVKMGKGGTGVTPESSVAPSRATSVMPGDNGRRGALGPAASITSNSVQTSPEIENRSHESDRSSSRPRTPAENGSLRALSLTRTPSQKRRRSLDFSTTGPEFIPLKDELVLVHKMFPKSKVNFEKIDIAHRKLTMSLNGPWANGDRFAFIRIHWTFPPKYPHGPEIPTFELERNATVSPITRHRIVSTIKEIRAANKQCLVSVTEFLLGYHERMGRRVVDEESGSESDRVIQNVPMLVRSTGATFGPNGQLVCFFPKQTVLPRARTSLSRSPSGGRDPFNSPLARAITALSRLENPHKPAMMRYKRHIRKLKAGVAPVQARSTLTIHNVSHLVGGPDANLAAVYTTTSIDANLVHALDMKRLDHAEVWAAVRSLLTDPPPPYSRHPPFHRDSSAKRERMDWEVGMERKRRVLDKIFDRLMEAHDIQLLALIACILKEYERTSNPPPPAETIVHHSPEVDYFDLPTTTTTMVPTAVTVGRRHSSNTPTTPPQSGPSSFRTSGWSQILMNPSSISLRGMALTPRDRTSFDLPNRVGTPRTPIAGSFEEQSQMGVSIPPRSDTIGPLITGTSLVAASPRRLDRRESRESRDYGRAGRDPRPRPLSMTTAGTSGSTWSPPGYQVPPTPGRPPQPFERDTSGASLGDAPPPTGRSQKVSFGSASPLRRTFSRAGGVLTSTPERKRRHRTVGVRIDLIVDEHPRTSLLRDDILPLAEAWKLIYADYLLRIGHVGKRAALLQYDFAPVNGPALAAAGGDLNTKDLAFATMCQYCHERVVTPGRTSCPNCSRAREPPHCSVCRLPIKGLATTCTVCSHTSHTRCLRPMLQSSQDHCPACLCHCLAERGVSGSFYTALPPPPSAAVQYGFDPDDLGMSGQMSPTSLIFDGPHAAMLDTPPNELIHPEPIRRTGAITALELTTGLGAGPSGSGTASAPPADDKDKPLPPPPPREGLLARSRLRALGAEGILGW